MRDSQRVLVNTTAQYIRTVINTLLAFYTVRLVLSILGASDYGIYTLIAGVVSMLTFITNSLMASTQRFISFYQGKGNLDELKKIFNNSLVIHILLSLAILLLLLLAMPVVFGNIISIPEDRLYAAKFLYLLVLIMVVISFISAPYKALLISHENIVFISVVEVLDAIAKVLMVIWMSHICYDKLILYGIIIAIINLISFICFAGYSYIKYEECVLPRISQMNKTLLGSLMSFAGWSLYGTMCQVGQKEGIAIVLNRMMGTVVNAAYGVGFQVSGYTSVLSTSIVNAIKPQIVKAEGRGDRGRSLWLSNITSKFMFFLLALVCVPCCFEIDSLLRLWLGDNPPQYTSLFCIMSLLTIIADATTVGLTHINAAIGDIKKYTIVMNTPKLLTFPIAYIFIKIGLPLYMVVVEYVFVELLMAIIRISFLHKQAGLDVKDFIYNVLVRGVGAAFFSVLPCYLLSEFYHGGIRLILTFVSSMLLYTISFYYIGLCKQEKQIINSLVQPLLTFLKKK